VEVRSREEILATLGADGALDGMPFMPEMLAYCGRRFRVAASAHKSCDTVHKTWTGRRLDSTVHLVGLRCDGAAHGGCQADCNLFWKDAWLKPVASSGALEVLPTVSNCGAGGSCSTGCTEAQLTASTSRVGPKGQTIYSCQATQHFHATEPLAWWDVRQYLRDVTTGNYRVGHVVRVLVLGVAKQLFAQRRFGYRFFRGIRNRIHRLLTGRDAPDVQGTIANGSPTPTGRLNLRPGEYVRVKSKKEIEKTINDKHQNRGLSFDQEMVQFCGRVFQVRSVVTQIIDEPTGEMIPMKQPCITLQGVVCASEFSSCRLMCPRAIPSYWRELWLERVETESEPNTTPRQPAGVGV
jgi:hypothetical protein